MGQEPSAAARSLEYLSRSNPGAASDDHRSCRPLPTDSGTANMRWRAGHPYLYWPWPGHPRPWWSRPAHDDVCSMFARMSRYGPVTGGTTRHPVSRFAVQPGRSQHFPALSDTAYTAEQRTLNLRVRGSSPWRRTHSELGLYPFRALSCSPFRGHGCSTVARQSGPSTTTAPWHGCIADLQVRGRSRWRCHVSQIGDQHVSFGSPGNAVVVLVAGTAPISRHRGREWTRWSRPFARMPESVYPTDVATQRDTSWQANG